MVDGMFGVAVPLPALPFFLLAWLVSSMEKAKCVWDHMSPLARITNSCQSMHMLALTGCPNLIAAAPGNLS